MMRTLFPKIRYLRAMILCVCGVFLAPVAQAAAPFLARSWQSEDGFPSNVVRALAQANDGYLWVGTAEGVVRFDGQHFTGFRSSSGNLPGRSPVRALFPLANGEVWVSTMNNTLLRGRGASLDEVILPDSVNLPPTLLISQVVLGENGHVFVGRGAEVWEIDGDKVMRVTQRTAELERLLQQDAAAEPERGHSTPGDATVRLRDARGQLWEFRPGAGLTVTDSSGLMEPVLVQSESPAEVRAMLVDREGNLWLATGTQGLWRLRPSRISVLTMADGLSDRATLAVFEDHTGALWIAPQSGGLDCLSAGSVKHFDVQTGRIKRPISAIMETRAGVLWIATRDGQVYILKDGSFAFAFPGGRGPSKILAIAEDELGRMWFGGSFGLSVWDGEKRRVIDFGTPEVVTVVVTMGSTIWVGTDSGRVFRGNGERFEAVTAPTAFGQQSISSLLPEADGTLWISTLGSGLFRWREGQVHAFASGMSQVDPRITCVMDDGAGCLWLGTLGGICRVQKAKLFGGPAAVAGSTLVFDRSDGLLTRECTRGGQPAGWLGHNGTLYFCTGHGIAHFNPSWLNLNTVPPPVLIEEAGSGEPLAPIGERLEVGPGRSRLEISYTALSFTAPEKVRFRTKLEGLDETWRDAGNERSVAYEAVPPGRYRFRVVADNGDGIWNEVGATLPVVVTPHLWETRWFQIGVALLAVGAAVGVGALFTRARMRERLLRLEALTSREKERARIAQDLHDDLGASLTEISLLANLAAEERGLPPGEDDTLPEVATKAQALVGVLDEIVWAVNPRHDTLRSLAEYLAAFGGKFLSRAGMTLRRDMPRELPEVGLDAERRHSLFLAVREALNNVVKHSGATEVWLRLTLENQRLEIVVEDNGRGFDSSAPDAGNGLGNLASRLACFDGKCHIESHPGGGTKVMLSLPLN